ncbi:hypothetical protein HanPSC8_Chr06g0251561 [Helianthus annuus]|nr:hypothetical protein HanPSC8_Chr06g0251561 [Helianthus annuus]
MKCSNCLELRGGDWITDHGSEHHYKHAVDHSNELKQRSSG